MTGLPIEAGGRSRRRRKLNQPLIKSAIVFLASGSSAIGSAVTGIGAHLGFAPMLTWMFGYSQEKSQGTALRISLCAALGAAVGALMILGNAPAHISRGVLLMIGATIGAIGAAPITPKPTATGLLRALQGIAVLVAVFTVTEAVHLSAVTRSNAHYAHWSGWWQILLLGAASGAITQSARLAGGTILVPALFFLTALPDPSAAEGLRPLAAQEAVVESLIVVFLAGLLPAWGYAQRRLADSTYLIPAIAGALLGGLLGGWLLTRLLERSVLILFGLVAMFFAAREIYRLAYPPPEAMSSDQAGGPAA